MIRNQGLRMAVNRIMAFLIGGLLVYAVISMTVVSNIRDENEQLARELDETKYDPGRLLADARASYADREFESAIKTLAILLEERPGSSEAVEGKKLYDDAEAAIAQDNASWEAAVVAIRERWVTDMTAQLRGKSEQARLDMEKGLDDTLTKEWEKMKDQIRKEWSEERG